MKKIERITVVYDYGTLEYTFSDGRVVPLAAMNWSRFLGEQGLKFSRRWHKISSHPTRERASLIRIYREPDI
jgi:hypothetical protein